eukprot:scaffold133183_cov30-Tisochrysis_lutea.AAC.8
MSSEGSASRETLTAVHWPTAASWGSDWLVPMSSRPPSTSMHTTSEASGKGADGERIAMHAISFGRVLSVSSARLPPRPPVSRRQARSTKPPPAVARRRLDPAASPIVITTLLEGCQVSRSRRVEESTRRTAEGVT